MSRTGRFMNDPRWGLRLVLSGIALVVGGVLWTLTGAEQETSASPRKNPTVLSTPLPTPTGPPVEDRPRTVEDAFARLGSGETIRTGGPHEVVLTITSDAPLSKSGMKTVSGEATFLETTPVVTVRRTITGHSVLAVIAAKTGPAARSTSCTATVDGRVVDVNQANGPGQFVICIA